MGFSTAFRAVNIINGGIWMKKAMVSLFALALCFCSVGAFADPPKVGMCIYKFDDTFMSYVRNTVETLAKGNLDLSTQDSQFDQPKQNDQIDQFLTQGVKSLAINMVDPSAANVLIQKTAKKKVPLILFNREPGDIDLAKYPNVYYVGAKAQESGTMQGQIVAKYWKAHPEADLNKDGVLSYVMLMGDPSNSDAKFRTQYSIEAVKAAGIKVKELAEDTAMWDRPKAQEKMAAWLAAFPGQIDVVFANNDDMALGAIEALKAAGYFKGGKYMPVVGVDATPPAKDALKQGELLGTVLNDANGQGTATYELAASLAAGKPAKTTVAKFSNKDGKADPKGHYVWVPYQMVTKDNVDSFK
jgi:methyl-galactoside transport system substrate-binding protein